MPIKYGYLYSAQHCSGHIMKLFILVTVCVAVSSAAVQPIPVYKEVEGDVKLTWSQWQNVMAAQKLKPEVCLECRRGFKPQPADAGRIEEPTPIGRIIGGSTAYRGQFPWQVAVHMDNSYFCGGSLISDEWVLTAGHCGSGFSTFVLDLGSHYAKLEAEPNRVSFPITAKDVFVHDEYDSVAIANDIAVMRLPEPVELGRYINVIRLPSHTQALETFEGDLAKVSGWGRFSSSSGISEDLNFASLPVISNEECARTFGSTVRSTNVCTSTKHKKSSCNGDSGGALAVRDADDLYTQIGIVSFGRANCPIGAPNAFTRVTSYLQWIENSTGIKINN